MSEIPPIYFSTLEIENVRCFGEGQVLRLTDDNGRPAPWSLLIGENGTGKTTLLECLAWMRPEPDVDGVPEVMTGSERQLGAPLSGGLLKSALSGEENEVLETLPRNGSREVTVDAKLSFGGVGLRPDGMLESAHSQAKDIRVGMRLSFNEQARLIDWEPLMEFRIETLGRAMIL